jgi:DNA-binding NtrC family response regulator
MTGDQRLESAIGRLQANSAQERLIGAAPVFARAIAQLPAVANAEATVLISGETGTGKELVARAIHYGGPRASFPFVAVNCGALPDTLLEDELFGHERGAFTDARSRRTGLIAEAQRGTLFLDEVESLTPRGQVALLRVLQTKTFRALGASREQSADVRFVAATNVSLPSMMHAGAFRTDLYYRLCVFSIELPALRERRTDIALLAAHFLKRHALVNAPPKTLSPAAQAVLVAYDWPGNVRELENAILRAVHLAHTDSIQVEDLGLPSSLEEAIDRAAVVGADVQSFRELKKLTIEAFEREYLTSLMAMHHGNVSHAARASGKERRDLGKLLKKYRLDPKVFAPR